MLDLTSVFRDVFDDGALRIGLQSTPKEVSGWDSYNHLRLALALEEVSGVAFSSEEITGMANVEAIVRILAARGVETAPLGEK